MTVSCSEPELGGMSVRQAFKDPLVSELAQAAASGNLSIVNAKIKAGADVNFVGTDGITPLLWVMPINHKSRNFSGVRRLLEAGANPNYREPRRNTSPMYIASGSDTPGLLELLLQFKGDPNLEGPNGESLLKTAVMQFRPENIDLLLKYGADINVHTKFGDSVPNVAAGLGRFDFVAHFLEKGFTYNLERLAKDVQNRRVPPNSDAQRWKDKVLDILAKRGVTIPLPSKVSTAAQSQQ
jgi:uncharacterized protein